MRLSKFITTALAAVFSIVACASVSAESYADSSWERCSGQKSYSCTLEEQKEFAARSMCKADPLSSALCRGYDAPVQLPFNFVITLKAGVPKYGLFYDGYSFELTYKAKRRLAFLAAAEMAKTGLPKGNYYPAAGQPYDIVIQLRGGAADDNVLFSIEDESIDAKSAYSEAVIAKPPAGAPFMKSGGTVQVCSTSSSGKTVCHDLPPTMQN